MTENTPTSEMTVEEMTNSLTGFDEVAIRKHMGFDPYADAESRPMDLMRALVLVAERRRGITDKAAYQAAMEMPISEVSDYFTDDDETDPEDPVTEPGKEPEPLS